MKKIILALGLTVLVCVSCTKEYTSKDYLKEVVSELEKIESVNYLIEDENWQPGDTSAVFTSTRYIESFRNTADTAVGSSYAVYQDEDKAQLEFMYDGKMRAVFYNDYKVIVIDSFTVRKLPFRPVNPPFFSYSENIIRYILANKDSTTFEQVDLGDEVYLKLISQKDRQVEFFGKAYYMPKNPYIYDPTSIYEVWIDKRTNLPKKVRREMSHDITVSTVLDYEFNTNNLDSFVASELLPKDYEIRQYGQKRNKREPNELIDKAAPDWTLQNVQKQNISLSDLNSKVIMLQFTSVSCGPCRVSIPFLKELTKEYNQTDFDFVAIESTANNTNVLKSYIRRHNFDYTILLSNQDVLRKYSISSYPVFFILDKNKVVKKVINGYMKDTTDNEIRAFIDEMIKK